MQQHDLLEDPEVQKAVCELLTWAIFPSKTRLGSENDTGDHLGGLRLERAVPEVFPNHRC